MKITFELLPGDRFITLAELRHRTESAYMAHVLGAFKSRGAAAAVLGISRKNLWERLKALGVAQSVDDTAAKPILIAA